MAGVLKIRQNPCPSEFHVQRNQNQEHPGVTIPWRQETAWEQYSLRAYCVQGYNGWAM